MHLKTLLNYRSDDVLSLFLNLFEVIFTDETFSVNFAHIFSAGRTRRKPAFIGYDFQAAD